MDAIKSKNKVDMNDTVVQLREDQMGMIQHTSQCKCAYQASVNYALKVFPDVGIFTEASNLSAEPFNEKLKADSMRKNGASALRRGKGGRGGSRFCFVFLLVGVMIIFLFSCFCGGKGHDMLLFGNLIFFLVLTYA